MSNPGEGGRYLIGPDGERTLVERTNWSPVDAPAPAEESPVTPEIDEEEDCVLSKEISAGQD